MLNNNINQLATVEVYLLFLFKKENDFVANARELLKAEYRTPWEMCLYYKDSKWHIELKWRINLTKLQIEFYLDILQAFTTPEENILGIFTEAKFMLDTKIPILNHINLSLSQG